MTCSCRKGARCLSCIERDGLTRTSKVSISDEMRELIENDEILRRVKRINETPYCDLATDSGHSSASGLDSR